MTATNEQIVAEANRRWKATGAKSADYPIFVIEVVREGWTPPEPVDPDVLAFREWNSGGARVITNVVDVFVAGARMARERDAKMTAEEKLLRAIFGPTGRPAKEADQ